MTPRSSVSTHATPTGTLGCGLSLPWLVGILAASVGLFLFLGGPLWRAPSDASHAGRLGYSYASAIPLVALALAVLGRFSLVRLVTATLLVWSAKLVVTVPLYYAIAPGTAASYRPAQPWAERTRATNVSHYRPAEGPFAAGTLEGRVVADGAPVAGAFVYVDAPKPGRSMPDAGTIRAIIADARYSAPIYALTTDDRFEVVSRDRELHTAHIYQRQVSVNNTPLPASDAARPLVFPGPGMYRIACDNHPDERTAVVVLDHPYGATTDADGAFRIPDVPAGEATLVAARAIADDLIIADQRVRVADTETTTVELDSSSHKPRTR